MNITASPSRHWNRSNLLPHIPTCFQGDFIQKATCIGIDPAKAPVGLMPCFHEMIGNRGIQLPGSPLIPLDLKPEANLEPSEALLAIKNSVCTLITTNRFNHPFFLIRRICFAFPESQIVIFTKTSDEAFALKQQLRADCQSVWHLNGEIPESLKDIQPRIRITELSARGLSLNSLRLHEADIVIAMDAENFARYRFLGPVQNLFNTQRGTFIQPGARLVGIIKEDAHIKNQRLVWPLFGLRTFQLGRLGKAYQTPLVQWFTRDKWDKSEQGLGPKPSNVDLKSRCIWNNRLRNHSLLRQVKRCRGEANQLAFVRSRYGNDFRNAVGLVVENEIHKTALMKELSGSVPCFVYTFDEIRRANDLPSLLVRGDAGTGLLPLNPQPHPTILYDLKDQSPWFLRKRAKQRQQVYLERSFVGRTPYQNKVAQKHLG